MVTFSSYLWNSQVLLNKLSFFMQMYLQEIIGTGLSIYPDNFQNLLIELRTRFEMAHKDT